MGWTRHVARMHLTTFLPANLIERIHLVDLGVDGRKYCKLISKMIDVKCKCLAQRRHHPYALFNSVIDFQIS
jgi:hypothetical protein